MIRRFDNYLVRADAVHPVVHAVALAIQLAFDSQSGKLIRNHAHPPTRLVAPAAIAVGQNLRRSFRFIAVIERAISVIGWQNRLADKIAGALGTAGCNDDPSPRDWVFTQFGQVTIITCATVPSTRKRVSLPLDLRHVS